MVRAAGYRISYFLGCRPNQGLRGQRTGWPHDADAGLPNQPEGALAHRRDFRLVQGDWRSAADAQTRRGARGLERHPDPEQLQLGADSQADRFLLSCLKLP
jgi:hypothetical protein